MPEAVLGRRGGSCDVGPGTRKAGHTKSVIQRLPAALLPAQGFDALLLIERCGGLGRGERLGLLANPPEERAVRGEGGELHG